MEAEWADHWFARDRDEASELVLQSAGISVLVQVGLALQGPSPHARDSSITVVAGTPRRASQPSQPFSRAAVIKVRRAHWGPEPAWIFSVAMDEEEEALGVVGPEVV